ncbi:MAG: acyltransferase family protein [Chlorobiaceae bacterium]
MPLKYRPDIDGLRAVAVLAVMFFHAGIPGFSGGFVGVDVFFVISGFLITSIILKEIDAGQFSIARFYERRIRRIFPALFPVIAFTSVVATFLYDPISLKSVGASIYYTTFFVSNIFLCVDSGYFNAASITKPLLHTWSLAVEEQFYIFFPLLLIAISRFAKKRYLPWLLGISLVSFSLSIYGTYANDVTSIWPPNDNQVVTFYFVTTRAWELLFGSFLALGVIPQLQSTVQRNIVSIIGLGLIVFSVCLYTEATIFPGITAMSPVLGSSLIIYSGIGEGMSIIKKFLSLKPMVFIGLISYSLYLWHWPLIAFTKYLIFRDLIPLEITGIILATFLISIFSQKFIEHPFRSTKTIIPNRKELFYLSAVVMLIFFIIGRVIYKRDGIGERFELLQTKDKSYNDIAPTVMMVNIPPTFMIGNKDTTPSFVLWGDSHAGTLAPAFINQSKQNKVSGFIFSKGGSPPLLGIEGKFDNPSYCKSEWNLKVIKFIQNHPNIKVVFLAASWAGYRNEYNNSIYIKGLNRTIQALREMGKKVVIIADVPRIKYNVPRIFAIHYRFPSHININQFLPIKSEHNKSQKEVFNGLVHLSEIEFIYPGDKIFDSNGRCRIIANKELLYSDTNHLSIAGSLYITSVFDDIFKKMANKM